MYNFFIFQRMVNDDEATKQYRQQKPQRNIIYWH